jgi:hypothetical protein
MWPCFSLPAAKYVRVFYLSFIAHARKQKETALFGDGFLLNLETKNHFFIARKPVFRLLLT